MITVELRQTSRLKVSFEPQIGSLENDEIISASPLFVAFVEFISYGVQPDLCLYQIRDKMSRPI